MLPSKMNFTALIFHSLSIISVFRKLVIIRSIILFLVYLILIYKNISILTLFPILCLLVFVFIIAKVSMRENMQEFNQSLENISTIDILDSSSNR